jgi:hypothetical protein
MARRKADGTVAPIKPGGFQPDRMNITPPKRASGGNSTPDRTFLEDEADSIVRLTVKPDDLPWDIELRWEGHADELDPEYWDQFMRGTRRCNGVAYVRDNRGGYIIDLDDIRLQRPCMSPPLNGSMVCQKHGGQVAHVREAAQRRLSHAAEKAANTLITLTDPRDELDEIVEQGVRVKAANSVLDRVGIKAGTEVEITVPGYKKVLERMFGEEDE